MTHRRSGPVRHDLPEYRRVHGPGAADGRGSILDEFATDDWDPLILQVNDDYPRSLAAYQLADVLLVNPIRDGMNLVAKEGPILARGGCALVLSTEAGAAAELGPESILVNPFDITQTAEALHEALTMSDSERVRRLGRPGPGRRHPAADSLVPGPARRAGRPGIAPGSPAPPSSGDGTCPAPPGWRDRISGRITRWRQRDP